MEQTLQELAKEIIGKTNIQAELDNFCENYLNDERYEELLQNLETLATLTAEDVAVTAAVLNKTADVALLFDLEQRAEHYYRRVVAASPDNVEALRGLRKIYQGWGDVGRAALLYEKELSLEPDEQKKLAGYLELGEIYRSQLDEPEKAEAAFGEALKIDPQNAAAISALAAVSVAGEKWELAVTYLEKELIVCGVSADLEGRIIKTLNKLAARPITHKLAEKLAESAKENGLESAEISAISTELAAEAQNWAEKTQKLAGEAMETLEQDPAKAAEDYVLIAEYIMVYGADVDAAEKWLESSLLIWPAMPRALSVLEQICLSTGRLSELAQKLEAMASSAPSSTAAAALLARAAQIYSDSLQNEEAAAATYAKLLQFDPCDQKAVTALTDYYRKNQKWNECLTTLVFAAKHAENSADKIKYFENICEILEKELGDKERAIPYYKYILSLDHHHVGAAKALEGVLRAAGDAAGLALCLTPLAQASEGAERAAYLKELIGLYEGALADHTKAVTIMTMLVREEPTAENLDKLLGDLQNDKELSIATRSLKEAIKETADEKTRIAFMLALASCYEKGDSPWAAADIYAEVLSIDPENSVAKEKAGKSETNTAGIEAVTMEHIAAATSSEEKIRALIAGAEEAKLDRPEKAVDFLNQAIALDKNNLATMDLLIDLLSRLKRLPALADILEKRCALSEGSVLAEKRRELAEVFEKLDNGKRAAAIYMDILQDNPDDAEALEALENLLKRGVEILSISKMVRPIYKAKGRYDALAEIDELLYSKVRTSQEKIELLLEIADCYDAHLSDAEKALNALFRALRLAPERSDIQAKVEATSAEAEGQGGYETLVNNYVEIARSLSPLKAQPLWLKVGEIASLRMKDLNLAATALLSAFTSTPRDEKVISAMGILFNEAGSQILLDKTAEMWAGKDSKFTKLLYKNLAKAAENGGAGTLATALWNKVRELDPEDSEVLKATERLAEASGDTAAMADNLRKKLEKATGAHRQKLVLQLADMLLEEDDKAAEVKELLDNEKGENPSKDFLARLINVSRTLDDKEALKANLSALISLQGAGAERNANIIELARLEDECGDKDGALLHIEEVLHSKDPGSEAITLLEELLLDADDEFHAKADKLLADSYAAAGRYAEAIALWEKIALATADTAAQTELYRQIAATQQNKLNDNGAAFATLIKVFNVSPKDAQLRKELETLAEASGNWEELVKAYQAALPALEGEVAATVINRRIAEILETKLGRAAEAIEYYKASGGTGGALPDDLPALQSMERLLRSQENSVDLAPVLEKMASLLPENDKKHRKEYLAESAKIYVDVMGDLNSGARLYESAMEIDPRDKEVLANLDQLYIQMADWKKLADLLTKRIEAAGISPDVVDLHLRRAKLMMDEFHDTQAALNHYKTVLVKKRNHEGAVAGLEELLPLVENKAEIAQILEPIYTSAQNNEKLAWILEVRLDLVEAPQKKSLLRRIGDIYENKLGKKAEAMSYARRAMHADPNDMGIQMWLAKLAAETENYDLLASAYVEEVENVDEKMALRFHRNAASIFHEKLQDYPAAIEEYRAIVAADPKDEKALGSMEAIFREQNNFAELALVLRKRADMTVGMERRREILSELGSIYGDKLSDGAKAIAVFKEVLAIAPDDLSAFENAERLLASGQEWDNLANFYKGEIERLATKRGVEPRTRRLELMLKRAKVLDSNLGDFDAATAILTDIFKEAPDNSAAWEYGEERITAKVATAETIALLEDIYQKESEWEKYIAILERKLQLIASQEERPAIYKEIATTILEKLGQSERAYMVLCRAFDEDRAAESVREMLEELTDKLNKYEDLAEIYADSLETLPDQDLRLKTILKLASIYDEKLKNSESAISWYEKALEAVPNDAAILANLDRLFTATEAWNKLITVLEQEIEISSESKDKVAFLLRLAEVWNNQLFEDEQALNSYKKVLELDPENIPALKATANIYEETDSYENLAESLRKQAELLPDNEEQFRIHKRLAELSAEEFSDFADSIEHWKKVIAITPSDEEAQRSLEFLLNEEERWEELADHYRLLLTLKSDEQEKAEIYSKLGVVLGEKLGRTTDALSSWEEVLNTDPHNLEALRALMPIYLERAMFDKFEEVAKVAMPLVEAEEAQTIRFNLAKVIGLELNRPEEGITMAKDYLRLEQVKADELEELGAALEKMEAFADAATAYAKAPDLLEGQVDKQVELYLKAANICRDKLESEKKATEYLESLREVKADHKEAFDRLRAIYKETEQWRKLIALDDDFVNYADKELAYELLSEIRDIQNNQLAEKEMAFLTACRAFKARPDLPEAAAALEEIGAATESIEEAVAIMEEDVENVADIPARVELLRRIAVIYAEKMDNIPEAERILKDLRAIAPEDLDALDKLAALAAREERFDKELEAMETKLSIVPELEDKKRLLYDIAHVYEDSIEDTDGAIATYKRILEYDPKDRNSLEQMQRIYTAQESWEELVETLSKLVELSQDVNELVEIELRVARILENQLERPDDAIGWYNAILELVPGHSETLSALENLYTNLERWRELVQVYEQELQATEDTDTQVAIMSKVAIIYETQFDSAQDAVYVYERILDIDSTNLKAFAAIERLLRTIGEWTKLISFLERHIALLDSNDEKVAIYLQIAEIYYQELKLVNKAEETYNIAYKMDSTNADAILALSQLYERSGNWFAALDMLQKGADVLGKDRKAVRLLFRMGRINQEMLWDMGTAKSCYLKALEIDDTHMASLAALKEIAYSEKDWDNYIEYLIVEADNADDDEEKCELYYETAEFFRTTKMDDDQAASFYEKALAANPEYLPAANQLAELCFKMEKWARARELYTQAINGADSNKNNHELSQKHYRLGYVCAKLDDKDEALNHYQKAVECDPTYLPALEGLSQALLNAEAYEEAIKVFQMMLIHHRDSLTESEVVDIQYQIGDLYLKIGQLDRALREFEKCLKIDPDHPQTLEAMAGIALNQGNYEEAYGRLKHLVEVLPLHDRVDIFIKMADIAKNNLGDAARAVWALENARQITPENAAVIEPLAGIYYAQKQLPQAVALYEQLVNMLGDVTRRRDLHFLLGSLYKDELNSAPKAVFHFNAALDADVSFIKAFEEIEKVLVAYKQWGLLEENYRRMIERMPRNLVAARTWLWRNLGDLYRKVLNNLDGAIMAYEVVTKLSPDTKADAEVLASLYAQKPEHRSEAIRIQHEALLSDANPVNHIRELRTLYHADQNFDAVYTMATALMALGEANQEEQQIFQYLSQAASFKVVSGLSEQMWQELVYLPALNAPISKLSAQLMRIAAGEITFDLKELGLKKNMKLDLRSAMLPQTANVFKTTARLMDLDNLEFYIRPGVADDMLLTPTNPPSLAIGQFNEMMTVTDRRLNFHLAREIFFGKPEFYLARVFSGEKLADVLFGIIMAASGNSNMEHNANPREVDRWAKHFSKIHQYLRSYTDLLRQVYAQLMTPGSREEYQKQLELTACRVGFIFGGSLDIAMKALEEIHNPVAKLDLRERQKQILLYSCTPEYLKVRQATGLALKIQKK